MSDPTTEAHLRRERDDARLALVEVLEFVLAELDHDAMDDNPAGYATSPHAQAAIRAAFATHNHTPASTAPAHRDAPTTLEQLADRLLNRGRDIEHTAVTHTFRGPDINHAMQGRGLGLQQAGYELFRFLANHPTPAAS